MPVSRGSGRAPVLLPIFSSVAAILERVLLLKKGDCAWRRRLLSYRATVSART